MDEYNDFVKEFSYLSINDNNRNAHSLLMIEPIVILPNMYNNVSNYKRIYTWNSKYKKFLEDNNIVDEVVLIEFPIFNNNSNPFLTKKSISFEDRKDLSLICRYRDNMIHGADATNLRYSYFENIDLSQKSCYGKIPYCNQFYRGIIGTTKEETKPSSESKLIKMNEYKFNLCFENCYSSFWSVDYITEKIVDCFKAKTIPIYYGCYNIEEWIPKELYIDIRDFSNIDLLTKYLKTIQKEQFEDMTEKAFEFVNTKFKNYGSIKILKEIIEEVEL